MQDGRVHKKTSHQGQGQSMHEEKVLKQFKTISNTCIYNVGNTNFVKYSSASFN